MITKFKVLVVRPDQFLVVRVINQGDDLEPGCTPKTLAIVVGASKWFR